MAICLCGWSHRKYRAFCYSFIWKLSIWSLYRVQLPFGALMSLSCHQLWDCPLVSALPEGALLPQHPHRLPPSSAVWIHLVGQQFPKKAPPSPHQALIICLRLTSEQICQGRWHDVPCPSPLSKNNQWSHLIEKPFFFHVKGLSCSTRLLQQIWQLRRYCS